VSFLRDQVIEFLRTTLEALTEPDAPPARAPKCWDFRDKIVTMMPRDDGQEMYVQYHGAYGPTPREGDYVIFKAPKPQGSRYRVTEVDFADVDWAWFAHLQFAPRTEEEVERDERALRQSREGTA
jgi:hypothetical protein